MLVPLLLRESICFYVFNACMTKSAVCTCWIYSWNSDIYRSDVATLLIFIVLLV